MSAVQRGRVDRVVVVGGGVAGVSCVAALRAGGYAGRLVLIDRAAFPYDRPPLSKAYLAGSTDLKAIALQQPEWYAEHDVELIGNAEVTAVDAAAGVVSYRGLDMRFALLDPRLDQRDAALGPEPLADALADLETEWQSAPRESTADRREGTPDATSEHRIDADWIVLATGGTAIVPPIPGVDSPRVHVLRDYPDADALRGQLRSGSRLLVVGAGLIGAEAASTASELGVRVTLVDPLDPPIAAAVGPDLARWLHDDHARHGVEALSTTLESLQDIPTGIAAQLRGEPDSREFDAVLIGVGMRPATVLAQAAGLEVDRGILVDERQVTSAPGVLAIGDSARLRDHARTEHWEAAQWDGQRAAVTILGAEPPRFGTSWFWSDRYHRHVEGVGEMRASDAVHTVVTRGEPGEGPFSVWTLVSTHGLRPHMADDVPASGAGPDGSPTSAANASTKRPSVGNTGLVDQVGQVDRAGQAASASAEPAFQVIGCAAVDDPNAVRAARRLIDPAAIADPSTNLRSLLRGR